MEKRFPQPKKKRDKLSKAIILTGVSKHLHEFSKENFRTLNGKF